MDTTRFDRISKAFSQRRLSRREALTTGGIGLAATGLASVLTQTTSAQDATLDSTPDPTGATGDHGPTMLFLQTYQSGTFAPVDGSVERFTLTLEAGSGQTIYFSDRPDRIVGTNPTPQFLEGLGFPEDNPPNAALVMETAPGETDIAVVELFSPRYDPESRSVTYEVEVLANWETSLEMGFTEAPIDLAAVTPAFGSAQLFIDDCPDATMTCYTVDDDLRSNYVEHGKIEPNDHGGHCYSWGQIDCLPCRPWHPWAGEAQAFWSEFCNNTYASCGGQCRISDICTIGFGC